MGAMLLNVILSVILMRPLGVGGLALAAALSSYFNIFALGILLRRRIGIFGIKRIAATLTKTLAASAVMGGVSYWLAFRAMPAHPAWGMISALFAGALAYFVMSFALNIEERKPLLALIFKDRNASDPA